MADNWSSPEWILELFKDYHDPCPIGGYGGLESDWGQRTYCNPPYSNPLPWVMKAIEENKKGKIVVMLLKLDSSTKWYKELVNAGAHILLPNERFTFKYDPVDEERYSGNYTASFPSMIAVLS